MNDSKRNGCTCSQTVKCSVDCCVHHENGKNLCSLDVISIGAREANPNSEKRTDCLSFQVK